MISIKRKLGQAIAIGDGIFVRVLAVSGKTVQIGIDCPIGTQVLREELLQAVTSENIAAAGTFVDVLNQHATGGSGDSAPVTSKEPAK